MPFVEVDRRILDRCLNRQPGAWEEFVDRFVGVFIHVIRHTAHSRSATLGPSDIDDLCSEIFLVLLQNDFAVLRHFKQKASLATYLAVIARRVVVKSLVNKKKQSGAASYTSSSGSIPLEAVIIQDESREQLEQRIEEARELMNLLPPSDAAVIKLHYLDGLSYSEISSQLSINENSIGPMIHRAKEKLRQSRVKS